MSEPTDTMRLVELTAPDLERLRDHASRQFTRVIEGGPTCQFWRRVLTAFDEALPPAGGAA